MIEGPYNGIERTSYNFTFMCEDPEGENVYYWIDCGDACPIDWIGPYTSGEEITVNHTWNDIGTFCIKAKAKDDNYVESDWSEPHNITIAENQIPDKVIINGPKWGFGGVEYEFTFMSTDADDHDLYYRINWDDGNDTGYTGPYNSGETLTLTHSWKKKGDYTIKAWAKDPLNDESGQASFKLNILTNADKQKSKNLLLSEVLLRLIENFPLLNKILNSLI